MQVFMEVITYEAFIIHQNLSGMPYSPPKYSTINPHDLTKRKVKWLPLLTITGLTTKNMMPSLPHL